MDELFTALDPSKVLRTYTKAGRTGVKPIEKSTTPISQVNSPPQNVLKREPLTTKNALKLLLEGTLKTKVCRYCLNVSSELSELDQILQIADKGTLYKVTIKDMVASFHPFKIADDPNFPDKICEKCIDRTLTSYLFTQQCEQAERALRNCFTDIYEKLDKLDPLERPKKRGRQKLNPNYNTLHAEHEKVIEYADPIIQIVNTASEQLTEQSPINELECLKCCELLPSLESLLNHTKIHPKSMWYNCRLCGQSFPKLHHLKKHMRSQHSLKTPPKTPEAVNNYDCKTCGVVMENYYQFLQHMEKHKFKMVMEHLVEGKMDNLCAVCMDKGEDMIGMDKMICLHGGCPELTGEKPIYQVLASTLPENKNKYQELLVPTQASIVKIVKKKIKNPKGTQSCFIFSKPDILTEDLDNENKNYNLFFFSEPQMVQETKSAEIKEFNDDDKSDVFEIEMENFKRASVTDIEVPCNMIMATPDELEAAEIILIDSDEVSDNCDGKSDSPETSDHLEKTTFSKPDYVEIDSAKKVDELKETKEAGSWIFNKMGTGRSYTVIKADTISNDNMVNNIRSIDSKSCNYCWVFKNMAKCEYCNTSDKSFPVIVKNSVPKSSHDVDADNDTANKITWHCNICLINNNINREICNCCEAKPISNIENSLRFNKTVANIELTKQIPKIKTDDCNTNIPFPLFDFQIVKESIENADKSNKSYSVITNVDTEEISMMETETTTTETEKAECPVKIIDSFVETKDRERKQEAMEIEEFVMPAYTMPKVDTNENRSMIYMSHEDIANTAVEQTIDNNNLSPNQFQFSIGSGSGGNDPRKYKRAVRRMGRAFHK